METSDKAGSLETLPLPFLAFGPITSIIYLHPSIGLLLLNMCCFIKLAICAHQSKFSSVELCIIKDKYISINMELVPEICRRRCGDRILGEECLPLFVTFARDFHLVPLLLIPNHPACFSIQTHSRLPICRNHGLPSRKS